MFLFYNLQYFYIFTLKVLYLGNHSEFDTFVLTFFFSMTDTSCSQNVDCSTESPCIKNISYCIKFTAF